MRFLTKTSRKQILFTFAIAAFSFMIIEVLYRGGFTAFADWLVAYPNNAIYLLLFLTLFYGILFLFNNKGFFLLAVFVTTALSFLAFAAHTKEVLRGDPLIPSDLNMGKEATNMLQFFATIPIGKLLVILLSCIVIVSLVVLIYRRLNNERNFIVPLVSLALFTIFLVQDYFFRDGFAKNLFNIEVNYYNQVANYHDNGVVLSFIRNFSGPSGEKPKYYSHNTINEIMTNIHYSVAQDSGEKPNIIVIQSEAFWDPTVMENVQFNKDPLPTFRQLSESYTTGSVTVPVYGGSTSNTEFEVLTGFSNSFLPAGSIPFKHFINEPLPSLPHILRNHGYESVAIHPYHNWFYDRNSIYGLLGFDNFLSLEFFPKPVEDAMYYRDHETTDEIIQRVKNADAPNFIFAVTMQNHGPYKDDRKKYYGSMVAEKTDGKFSPAAKNILEYFADNMLEVDKELKRLTDALAELDEKSIVVYFGDHLPLLGENYQVYREAGYFHNDQTYEDYLKMYQTPLLIWDNFGLPKEDVVMNSAFLGAYMLHLAGLEGYYFTDYLNELRSNNKSHLPRLDYLEHSQLKKKDIDSYRQLQYDILFGNQYGLRDNEIKFEVSKDYRLGYGDPTIISAKATKYKNKQAIELEGEYFTTSSTVYINGNPVDSTFISSSKMYAFVPKNVKPNDIIMKIFDSQNNLLAVSNTKKIN